MDELEHGLIEEEERERERLGESCKEEDKRKEKWKREG